MFNESLAVYLIDRYMGRMANSGKVCTLIMITINAMYNTTFTAPAESRLDYFFTF